MKFVAIFFLALGNIWAATLTSDGSQADTYSKVAAASAGDTVTLPAGTFTWTGGFSEQIAIYPGIHVRGAGSGRIVARTTTDQTQTVGTGTKTFTVAPVTQSGVTIMAGLTLNVHRLLDSDTTMSGTVTSYNSGTGELVMSISSSTGSNGTNGVWLFSTVSSTVIIANNTDFPFVLASTSTTASPELSGIEFRRGTLNKAFVYAVGTTYSAKPGIVHDCWLRSDTISILGKGNRFLLYNCTLEKPTSSGAGDIGVSFDGRSAGDPSSVTSWTEPSRWGADDTTLIDKVYIEDCDFHGYINEGTDFADNARAVVRHNLFHFSSVNTHGADTGDWGNRALEIYDNEFVWSSNTLSPQWWIWIRGGTAVITDNITPNLTGKPTVKLSVLNLGDARGPNPGYGSGDGGIPQWPAPRQPGLGYVTGTGHDGFNRSADSIGYVGDLEPIYAWNNTSVISVANNNLWIFNYVYDVSDPDNVADYIREGTEFKTTAKPGYVKTTYPHPLRTDSGVGSARLTVGTLSVGTLNL